MGRRLAVSLVQRVKISINHFQLSHALPASQPASSRHASHLGLEMEEGAGQEYERKERIKKEKKVDRGRIICDIKLAR